MSLWNLGSVADHKMEEEKSEKAESFKLLKSLSVATRKADPASKAEATKKNDKGTDEDASSNFLSGLLGKINVIGAGEKDVEVEVEDPPRKPFGSSLSSRWSSGGSKTTSDADEKEDALTKTLLNTSSASSLKGPSVYEDCLEMISAALLIYTFADLRKLAREGKIESKELMQQPISLKQVMEIIRLHKDALDEQARVDHEELEGQLKALKDIQKQQHMSTSVMGRMLRGKKKEAVLTHFHDEKSTQGMVYGIAINHIRKRITVLFRGSVTKQDFITDVKLAQKKVENPVLPLAPGTNGTINLHTGFYQYLFQEDDEGKVRLEHILEDVKALMKKNKGYRMYCTGHSLGGALASLCGFYASMDDKIVKNGPVIVVSIASPRVGNADFRAAFQSLERMKRLRHLRVSNREDLVTLLPFMATKEVSLLSPASILGAAPTPNNSALNLYKHCGIHLKFKTSNPSESNERNQLFSLTYAKDKNDEEGAIPDDLKRSFVAAKSLVGGLFVSRADFRRVTRFHSCDEYERRLMASKNFLENISLEQLYANEDLVGGTVAIKEEPSETDTSSRSLFAKRKSSTGLKAASREAIGAACSQYVK
ncbi:Phospholipase A1-II 7 [Seminavis robusta]|uniref:Phospholipase A1-II 7 n=1 Tax=Seminavis robusta TaxID=568900 RepID=A0A9N8H339_9STRA|nr:Phospholipase A1-II 7 [Seminavis robusta]|eukprot:Sro19_g013740.1 Phospholipase A1-II 7 (595) ;mRNA; f:171022-172900